MIKVSLRDGFGSPITNATDVRVRLSYLDADLGETAVSAIRPETVSSRCPTG